VAVAAGFPALRFHDLRHTFGTRMAAAGVPLRTLQVVPMHHVWSGGVRSAASGTGQGT
jgi:integrase